MYIIHTDLPKKNITIYINENRLPRMVLSLKCNTQAMVKYLINIGKSYEDGRNYA